MINPYLDRIVDISYITNEIKVAEDAIHDLNLELQTKKQQLADIKKLCNHRNSNGESAAKYYSYDSGAQFAIHKCSICGMKAKFSWFEHLSTVDKSKVNNEKKV